MPRGERGEGNLENGGEWGPKASKAISRPVPKNLLTKFHMAEGKKKSAKTRGSNPKRGQSASPLAKV